MSSVLADFTAEFEVESDVIDGPKKGRLVLGTDQLVLAASEEQTVTIPLSAVVDISPGSTPEIFDPLPGTPVTIAFEQDGSHSVALVAAETNTIEKFTTVLSKAVLNGTPAVLKHPAKLGGRVLDAEFRGAILGVEADAIRFETREGTVTIALDAVIDFRRATRTIDGRDRTVLIVDHMHNGDAMTTLAATDSPRTVSILGRFLRQEYEQTKASLQNMTLSREETELLTTIYSTGDQDVSLPGVLGVEPKQIKRLLHALHEKGLIESGEHSPVLTSKGQIVVNEFLERINA